MDPRQAVVGAAIPSSPSSSSSILSGFPDFFFPEWFGIGPFFKNPSAVRKKSSIKSWLDRIFRSKSVMPLPETS